MLPSTAFRPPVTLRGRLLRLEPLDVRFADPLALAGRDPETFRYLRLGAGFAADPTPVRMAEAIERLLERQRAGTDLPFVVLREPEGRPIGMTRYLDIDREHEWVEVGGTWFERALWGGPFNAASKRLMLGHAFEDEHVNRVQIKTDLRNLRSQRAIEKLGATREGVLREHVLLPDGYRRSSVYYSLLRSEWPAARARLDERLAAAPNPAPPSGEGPGRTPEAGIPSGPGA